jgi:hypothetical protein
MAAARTLGKAMADANIGLVYGGGSLGLMGEVARSVLENGGHVTGIISVVALSFIVHDPSGIIVRSSARSLSASRRR